VIGGGPAGLYFSSLWKGRHPRDEVHLFEQNPAGATWGFGVVFSDRALEFLRGDDPDTVDLISPCMQTWRDITIVHRGQSIPIPMASASRPSAGSSCCNCCSSGRARPG
jgi:2-polyprenyl-6-methoxyphenol hydroxylase-like FAD-dependent oxidoreductase